MKNAGNSGTGMLAGVLVIALALAGCETMAPQPMSTIEETIEVSATVEKIDLANRLVSLKGQSGDVFTVAVDPLAVPYGTPLWISTTEPLTSTPLRRLLHWVNRNSRDGSRDNIAAHYDLGNDFFRLFLDETMAYSCGIYRREDATLHEAQLAKFDSILAKLDLRPGETLVEIGTGWGGLAIHAAKHWGARVTTTTISKEQHAYAREWIAREGLGDRVTLLLEDYRDLRGSFDKAVSVEMIEAVGHQYLDTYFATCSRLLKPSGAMLLQAITLQDQHYANALKNVDFIQRFVFPGSFIPSVTAIADSLTRATDLKVFHLEDIGPHYATTLRHWRERCFARLPEVRALGYPEEFVRLWEFYLCYCEGGFLERQLGDVHLLLTKPLCRRAPVVLD